MFVKRLKKSDGYLLDFAILSIAKACGVRCPKIKLKITNKNFYLFSTEISKPKINKTYDYADLGDYLENPTCYFDIKKLILFRNRKSNGAFLEQFNIDRLSIANIFITCALFNLSDINLGNIGIVISHKLDNQKAKLALLDFITCNDSTYFIVDGLRHKESSLGEIIKRYMTTISENTVVLSISQNITDDEYLMAFGKIIPNFLEAHSQAKNSAEKIFLQLSQSFSKEEIDDESKDFTKSSEIWLNNFLILKDKYLSEQKKLDLFITYN